MYITQKKSHAEVKHKQKIPWAEYVSDLSKVKTSIMKKPTFFGFQD